MFNLTTKDNKTNIDKKDKEDNIENHPKYNQYKDRSLESLLDQLIKYGKHSLSYMGNGWYCSLDIYVSVIGAELKVTSNFKNETHKNAVIQVIIRLEETINEINKTNTEI